MKLCLGQMFLFLLNFQPENIILLFLSHFMVIHFTMVGFPTARVNPKPIKITANPLRLS